MYLGFFVYSRLLCIRDELEGMVMDNYCDYWMLAIPFRNYRALDWKGWWSLKNSWRSCVTAAVRLPSPGRPNLSLCPKLPVHPRRTALTSWSWSTGTLWKCPGYVDVQLSHSYSQPWAPKHPEILDKCEMHSSRTTFSGWKWFSSGKLQLWIRCKAFAVYEVNLQSRMLKTVRYMCM